MARRTLLLTVIGLSTIGCSTNSEPPFVATAAEDRAAATPAVSTEPPSVESTPAETVPTQTTAFQPPFPHRTNLFEPPHGGKTAVRRDDEHGESIELKGFIDVNGPQVVLAIDGVLLPIPEGGEKYGVQVISINPPQVVLQRGRSRWTASLE